MLVLAPVGAYSLVAVPLLPLQLSGDGLPGTGGEPPGCERGAPRPVVDLERLGVEPVDDLVQCRFQLAVPVAGVGPAACGWSTKRGARSRQRANYRLEIAPTMA